LGYKQQRSKRQRKEKRDKLIHLGKDYERGRKNTFEKKTCVRKMIRESARTEEFRDIGDNKKCKNSGIDRHRNNPKEGEEDRA